MHDETGREHAQRGTDEQGTSDAGGVDAAGQDALGVQEDRVVLDLDALRSELAEDVDAEESEEDRAAALVVGREVAAMVARTLRPPNLVTFAAFNPLLAEVRRIQDQQRALLWMVEMPRLVTVPIVPVVPLTVPVVPVAGLQQQIVQIASAHLPWRQLAALRPAYTAALSPWRGEVLPFSRGIVSPVGPLAAALSAHTAFAEFGAQIRGPWLSIPSPAAPWAAAFSAQTALANMLRSPWLELQQQIAGHALVINGPWRPKNWLAEAFQPWLTDMLKSLRFVGGRSLFEDDLYAAAVATRGSILEQPQSDAAVRQFARTWLRIRDVNDDVVYAVVLALLADDWLEADLDEPGLRRHLKLVTSQKRQGLRDLGEIRVRGRVIGSLDEELAPVVADGVLLTSGLRVPAATPEDQVVDRVGGFEAPVLVWLLEQLDESEVAVLHARSHRPFGTWKEAAVDAGVDPRLGDRTRRRIDYLMKSKWWPRQQAGAQALGLGR